MDGSNKNLLTGGFDRYAVANFSVVISGPHNDCRLTKLRNIINDQEGLGAPFESRFGSKIGNVSNGEGFSMRAVSRW
jgi:hypothetical protein